MKRIISVLLTFALNVSVLNAFSVNAYAENIVTETIEAYASAQRTGDTISSPSPYYTVGSFWGNSIAYGFDLTEFKGAAKFITSVKAYIYPYNPSNISGSWKGYRDNDSKFPELIGQEAYYDAEWQKVFKNSYVAVSYFSLNTGNKTDLETVDEASPNILSAVTANVKTSIDSTGYYTLIIDHNDGLETKFQPAGKKFAAKLELTYDKDEVCLIRAENTYDEIKKYTDFESMTQLNDGQLVEIKEKIDNINNILTEVSDCQRKTDIKTGLSTIENNIEKKNKLNDFRDITETTVLDSQRDYYFKFTSPSPIDICVDGNNLGVNVLGDIIVKLNGKKVYIFTKDSVIEKDIASFPYDTSKITLSNQALPTQIQDSPKDMGIDNINILLKLYKIATNENADGDDFLKFCDDFDNFPSEYQFFSFSSLLRAGIYDVYVSLIDDYERIKELARIYSYIMIAEESLTEEDLNTAITEATGCTNPVLISRLENLKNTVKSTVPYVKNMKMTGEFLLGGTINAEPVICYPNNSVGQTFYEWKIGNKVLSTEKSLYINNDYENKKIYCYVTPTNAFGEKGTTVKSIEIVIGDEMDEEKTHGFALKFVDVPITGVSSFYDTKEHWARDIIEYLAGNGIVNGVKDNYFMPDDSVTRAQFVKMIMSIIDVDLIEYGNEFGDVSSEDWFADYISTAYYYEIVNGTDGKFMPNDFISRQEMAAIIVRVAEYRTEIENYEKATYIDREDISNWAISVVDKAAYKNYMNGTPENKFLPKNDATRAEAASVIYKLLLNEKE